MILRAYKVQLDVNEHTPNFSCSDCGNTDKDRFRTIRTESQDGTEYDLECTVCGSLETEESPEMALHRMAVKLENCRNIIKQIEEIINLGLPTNGMYSVYNRFKKISHILKDI